MFYVYTIWCDSEAYVGFTSRPPPQRWVEHKKRASDGSKTKFHTALRKTGITRSDVQEIQDEVSALKMEIIKIHCYSEMGICLNSTSGGEGNNFKVRYKDSEWVITKVSQKAKLNRRRSYRRKSKRRR